MRILYDRYMAQLEQQQGASQQLLFPESLTLAPDEVLTLAEVMPDLRHVGFDLADEGEGRYRVNGIPAQLEAGSASDLLHHVLADARAALADPARRIRESIAASLATADSLKPGQPLTDEEMGDLIDRLFASSNPNYAPDGRKIVATLPFEELERLF